MKERKGFDNANEEVGWAEMILFEGKVKDLIKHPNTDNPLYWTTRYKKDNKSIKLQLPRPGFEFPRELSPTAEVDIYQPMHLDNSPNILRKFENITLYVNRGKIWHSESIEEVDPEGNIVDPLLDEFIKGNDTRFVELFHFERALGLHKVTHAKFQSVMTILNSLTHDEEIY